MNEPDSLSRAEFDAFREEVRTQLDVLNTEPEFLRTMLERRAAALRKAEEEDERAAAEVRADLERWRAKQKPMPDSRPLIAMLEARRAAREASRQAERRTEKSSAP